MDGHSHPIGCGSFCLFRARVFQNLDCKRLAIPHLFHFYEKADEKLHDFGAKTWFHFCPEVRLPSLHWLGKDAVLNHHLDVPYKTLELKDSFNCEKGASENKIIHGDNLEALKALMPEYEGKVKCIYIDPPYNTGNENWVYNDNVNSPKIRKWLGQVVGKEAEDLTRHDKWLCMMYPRLKLLHKLLREDGAIFISIDDNEQANLKLMCDEIFGAGNFVGSFIWVRKKKGSFLSSKIRKMTEYILCYQKTDCGLSLYGENAYSDKWQPIVKRTNALKTLVFPQKCIESKLKDGFYEKGFRGNEGTGITFENSFNVENGFVKDSLVCKGHFTWSQDFLSNEIQNGTRISLSSQFGFNVLRYNQDEKIKSPSTLINSENGVGTNEDASANLQEIFGSALNEVFSYSKPFSLLEYVIKMLLWNDKDSIILDSFAGSGTTAHAVLNLNKQDGGNRKFILVEMEDYANNITAERVRRVINGYGEGKNAVEGTGGDFNYYELGAEMLLDGSLNEEQPLENIRNYIYYTETNSVIDSADIAKNGNEFFLGNHDNAAYYLFYKKSEITTLDFEFLGTISQKAERYVIYADNCVLPKDFLFKNNIVFKKIPRDVRKF